MRIEGGGDRQERKCIEVEVHRTQLLRTRINARWIRLIDVRLNMLDSCPVSSLLADVGEDYVGACRQRSEHRKEPNRIRGTVVEGKPASLASLGNPFPAGHAGRCVTNLRSRS